MVELEYTAALEAAVLSGNCGFESRRPHRGSVAKGKHSERVPVGQPPRGEAIKTSNRVKRARLTLRARAPPGGLPSDPPVSVYPANPSKSAPARLESPGARPSKG